MGKLMGWVIGGSVAAAVAAMGVVMLRQEGSTPSAEAPATRATSPAEQTTGDWLIAANDLIVVDSPASSHLEYPSYPPFGAAWDEMAKASWERNQPAFAAVRELLRGQKVPVWPADVNNMQYLSPVRSLANHLGDAALYL